MTLIFALASAVAASTIARPAIKLAPLSPSVIKLAPILDRPLTPPRTLPRWDLIVPPAPRCSDANIDHVQFVSTDPSRGLYKLVVYFKDFTLSDTGAGVDTMTCTLSTKMPAAYGDAVSLVYLNQVAYTIESSVPNKTVDGKATFGIGIVDSTLADGQETGLAEGAAPETDSGNNSMLMMKRNNNEDESSDMKREAPQEPKDGNLIRTTGTSFGSMGARGLAPGNGEQELPIALASPPSETYPVDSEKMIVNQITLTIKGTQGVTLGASVKLKSVEIDVQSKSI